MPIQITTDPTKEIKELSEKIVEMVGESYKGFNNSYDYFQTLRRLQFSKLELLIIDSAFKGMPIIRLDKTLMLKQYQYLIILKNLIQSLTKVIQDETLRPIIKKRFVVNTSKSTNLTLAQKLRILFSKRDKPKTHKT